MNISKEFQQRISANEYRLQCQHNVAETLYLTVEMEQNGDGLNYGQPITFTQQPPITNHPLTDPALARCVNDTLELDQNAIPTEQQLANIANLECFGEEVVSLQGVESLSSLRHLDLGFNQISDISSLSNLTSLNTLYLDWNNITDISALSGLNSLETLYLSVNQISDISSLSSLTALKNLGLYSNTINSISSLSSLVLLEDLNLGENNLTDISSLSNLTSLNTLGLEGSNITDISALSGLNSLKTLYLSENPISDISLSNLNSLERLYLSENQISDISSLSNLTSLNTLGLGGNNITDISSLSNLISLNTLYLDGNNITDISALSGLNSLETLYLNENQISDINLSNLTSLNTLKLGWNNITDISLSNLNSLEMLFLNDNQISDISSLSNLTSLQWLQLSNNQISNIDGLANLTNLEGLDLSGNLISDLNGISAISSNVGLAVTGNCIVDFTPVDHVLNIEGRNQQNESCGESGEAISVVDGFDYPFGDRGRGEGLNNFRMHVIPEQINLEKNTIYTDINVSEDNYVRLASNDFNAEQWRNAQDVGSYYASLGGVHPGEDWSLGGGNDDAGQPIYAIADGQVHAIQSSFQSGYNKGGWTIVLKHKLHDGSFVYSIYTHVSATYQTEGGLNSQESDFGISEGDIVEKGQMIARLTHGDYMEYIPTAHLHFELRTVEPNAADLWLHDNGNGYYSHDNSKATNGMTAAQIQTAFNTMQNNVGLVDPSDYIEVNRISQHILTEAVVNNVSHGTLTPGETVTFTAHGENLPASIAISLHGAECGQTYNITETQVSIDCQVPETGESQLNLYIGGYPGSGSALNGAEDLRVSIGQQQDNIAPVIALNGTANMDVTLGSAFSVPEATATDDVDGDITANIVVGGDTVDTNTLGTYIITYNVSDSAGNAATEVTRTVNVIALVTADMPPLNDTGITWGGNYPDGNNIDCTGETVGEQDCSHGRDYLAEQGQLNKVGAGDAGFDFTKLASNGDVLDASATSWSCVKDNHTGLIWEVKTDTAQGTNLHSKADRYNWYNTDSTTNGGADGYADDGGNICYGYIDADGDPNTDNPNNDLTNCNTQAFVARVNTAGLCGATDWRLPNLNELQSIANLGKIKPAIDTAYFPQTQSRFYWSSSPVVYSIFGNNSARGVVFDYGGDGNSYHYFDKHVRLVRGGQ